MKAKQDIRLISYVSGPEILHIRYLPTREQGMWWASIRLDRLFAFSTIKLVFPEGASICKLYTNILTGKQKRPCLANRGLAHMRTAKTLVGLRNNCLIRAVSVRLTETCTWQGLLVKNVGPDQSVRMSNLVWVIAVYEDANALFARNAQHNIS